MIENTFLSVSLPQERDLLNLFKIPDRLCVSFFLTVEQHYLKDVSFEFKF